MAFDVFSRRHIVKGLLALLPIGSISFRRPFVKWQGTGTLATPMSWEKFVIFQSTFMNVSYLHQLERELVKSGKIQLAYTRFDFNTAEWTYIFKDDVALKDWLDKSVLGVNRNAHPTMKFESRVSKVGYHEIDWFHPYLLIPSNAKQIST